MEVWARGAALAAVVLLWVAVRAACGKPILHPWLGAMVLAGLSVVFVEASNHAVPSERHLLYGLSCFTGCLSLLAFAAGLRHESGAAPASRRFFAIAVGVCALVAVICAALPAPRDRLVADTLGASFLLTSLPALISAQRRRVGSFAIATGILVYAAGRTVLALINARGGDAIAAAPVADALAIAALGLGLATYALEAAREALGARKAARAVGGDPTLA